MSVIIGATFPDFALLLSDSRVTIGDHTRDEAQKLFRVSDRLAVGYVSNNAQISLKIIKEISRYSRTKARSNNTLYLLGRLPRVANYYYQKLTDNSDTIMEFIYAGVIADRGTSVRKEVLLDSMGKMQGSFALSHKMQAFFLTQGDRLNFPPPASVMLCHRFPSGDISASYSFGVNVVGSGSGIYADLIKEIEKIFLTADETMQIAMLQIMLEEYLEKNPQIRTIGGLSQILLEPISMKML